MIREEILKRLREVVAKTDDPMVYAIIQLIEAGRDPERALLDGFLMTAECLRQTMALWKKHLESQPIHGLRVMLEGPSEEKSIHESLDEPDVNGPVAVDPDPLEVAYGLADPSSKMQVISLDKK